MHAMNSFHFVGRQFEVKHFKVFFDVLLVSTLWDDYKSSLYLPSDGHLCGALIMLFADCSQSWVIYETSRS